MSETSPDTGRRLGSLRVGRLAGVPVFISYSWIIVAGFLAVMFAANIDAIVPGLGNQRWVGAISFVLLFYGSVFLHEAAHTLLAKALGFHVTGIVLHFFGGYSEMSENERSPWRSMAVAVAGPVASIAVALVCWALPGLHRHLTARAGHRPPAGDQQPVRRPVQPAARPAARRRAHRGVAHLGAHRQAARRDPGGRLGRSRRRGRASSSSRCSTPGTRAARPTSSW